MTSGPGSSRQEQLTSDELQAPAGRATERLAEASDRRGLCRLQRGIITLRRDLASGTGLDLAHCGRDRGQTGGALGGWQKKAQLVSQIGGGGATQSKRPAPTQVGRKTIEHRRRLTEHAHMQQRGFAIGGEQRAQRRLAFKEEQQLLDLALALRQAGDPDHAGAHQRQWLDDRLHLRHARQAAGIAS